MDPAFLKQMALATIPPGLVGLAVLLAWSWRGGRADGAGLGVQRPWWAAGSALLGLAFVPIAALLLGRFSISPASASQWIPWFGVMAAVAAFVVARWSASKFVVWAARLAVLGAIGWLSVQSQARASWAIGQTVGTLAGFVGLSALVLACMDVLATARSPRSSNGARPESKAIISEASLRPSLVPSLVGMILLGGIAQVLVLGFFTLVLAQVAGVTAALAGGVFVGSLWKRRVLIGRGVLDAPIVLGLAMLLHGHVFGEAERPWVYFGLINAAPVAAALAGRVTPLSWQAWKRGVIEVAAALVPVVVAVGWALAHRPQE